MHRLIYYVLPGATETGDLARPPWVLAQTWFLDVAAIPKLSEPTRKSQCHHVTLNPRTGTVLITSDPVRAEAISWEYIARNANPLALGATFENFEKFWACVFRSMPATSSGACRAMIPVHVGPPFRSMPAGDVTRVNRRYRGLFFRWEGELRWGKRGYPCARFERFCGSRPKASVTGR